MSRGIFLGLLAQIVFTTGFLFINQATSIRNQLFKTTLGLCFAGLLSLAIVTYFVWSGTEDFSGIRQNDLFYLAAGAVLIWVVGDTLAISGMAVSNITTVAYTAMARPAVALFLEYMLGQVTPTPKDFIGFGCLAVGFAVILTR